jgi:hypothetical protein
MTVVADREWDGLAAVWRDTEVDRAGEIRALVRRQSRRMRYLLALEVVVTIVVLGLVASIAIRRPGPVTFWWALASVLHTAVVWAFAWWNRRGVWRPMAETTSAYLRLALDRTLRQRRAAWFAIGLVAIEGAVMFAWVELEPARGVWPWISAATVFLGAIAVSVVLLLVSGRRLARLRALDRAMRQTDALDPIGGDR